MGLRFSVNRKKQVGIKQILFIFFQPNIKANSLWLPNHQNS